MHKTDFAESILSLVTSQERAASIAGDLLEEYQQRGWQFWLGVAQTALCQMWRQAAGAPLGMAGTAARAMAVELGYFLITGPLVFLGLWATVPAVFHTEFVPPDARLCQVVVNLLVPLQLGRWISRCYPGRQAAAIFSLASFHAAINLGVGLLFWEAVRHGMQAHFDLIVLVRIIDWDANLVHTLLWTAFYLTLYQALMLAGAYSVRSQNCPTRS